MGRSDCAAWAVPPWKIKSFFSTPRDEVVFQKVRHRTLYVAAHDRAGDPSCRACGTSENILHLATCGVIVAEFWDEILKFLSDLGMERPRDRRAFLVTGALAANRVINRNLAGVLSLAWRCLYAARTKSRIDNKPLDLDSAVERTYAMTFTRLTAYGVKWRRWVRKNHHTDQKHVIPEKERDKKLITQDAKGAFTLNRELLRRLPNNG